ncbi:hypothetical protein TSUD_263530 [Trifolium subterraneum]|uniref:Uncharacterized protein n=1 Tax=Trifolium subterraneum TaxID=3900 RepID=A0A2Z6NF99_TRISU|nr:hypothetical protein TSUD_263530 [Trifolium subterraneum]
MWNEVGLGSVINSRIQQAANVMMQQHTGTVAAPNSLQWQYPREEEDIRTAVESL